MRKNIFLKTFFIFSITFSFLLYSSAQTTTEQVMPISVPQEIATTTNIISELPHYIRFWDFSENKVLLQDYSTGLKSKYYICDFSNNKVLDTDCTATSSDTFPKNNLDGQGFYKYKFNKPADNLGIALKPDYKVEVSTTTIYIDPSAITSSTTLATTSSSTVLIPTVATTTSTTTIYKVYLLDRSGVEVSQKDTGIILDKYTGTYTMSNNIVVFIYHNDAKAVVYNLNTGEKLNEIILEEGGLDPQDNLSTINFSTISSDGKYLAWYIPFSASHPYALYGLTDLTTGKTIKRVEKLLIDRVNYATNLFAFSGDNQTLYFLSGEKGFFNIWNLDISKSMEKGEWDSSLYFTRKYTVNNFFVENDHMYFVSNREAPTSYHLYDFDLKKEKLKKLSDYPLSHVSTTFFYQNKIFYLYSDFAKGQNTAFYDIATKKNYYLPLSLDSKSEINLKKYSNVKNVKDNTILGVPDKIYKENDTLVMFLHGGPYAQTFKGYNPSSTYGPFDWILEGARKNGAYVAKMDYPGSQGYGADYINKLVGGIGKVDIEALNNSITEIKKQNKNIKKVYTLGISYGGYMTLKSYVESPNSFDKVFALAPVSDWNSEYETGPYMFFNSHFGIFGTSTASTSSTTLDLYKQADIVSKISTLPTSTALTIYQGTKDYTVPVGETRAFDALMKASGKEYTLNLIEDESHVFKFRDSWTKVCSDVISQIGLGNTDYCNLIKD